MDKYILVCTNENLGTYMVYKYHHKRPNDMYEYRRYDDEGVIIYKTKHAAQRKVDKLNVQEEI